MKADFTRFTYDARKHYTRVLKQQGRVDLDADWNEAIEIFTQRDRVETIDVIGRCGAPIHDAGFKVEALPGGAGLTLSPGRIYVDGILCEQHSEAPIALTEQDDLPGYELPAEDGVYLAFLDVWDRHVTALEDPEIREVALGGPDTTTRTRTVRQVRLFRISDDESLDLHECRPYPADPSTGRLAARAQDPGTSTNPCAVPEGAGYTGLENRLYRVEIHDDGRGEDGTPGARPVTFKWSRDNGSVVLPIVEENGIDGDTVSLSRLGFDDVLTVRVGDWVEILGEETELHGRPGTLAQIVPDGIDRADLQVELSRDVSAHAAEARLKMRRWDHQETEDLALIDGALPLPAGPFELEDGVIVEFEPGGTYHVGDYWLIPARTREGTVLWPQEGTPPVPVMQERLGIKHHYCTLALVRRSGGEWLEPRDCRPLFPPLTEVGGGGCCLTVEPGEDIQQALDTLVAAGGGCLGLCAGVHRVAGALRIQGGVDILVHGEGGASVVRFAGAADGGEGGFVIEDSERIAIADLFLVSDAVPALVTVRHGSEEEPEPARQILLSHLVLLNLAPSDGKTGLTCGVRVGHAEGVWIDACRIAAECGVVAVWGNTLGMPAGEAGEGETASPPLIEIGFEDLELDREVRVGESVVTQGVAITGEPFQWSNGQFTESGFARVEDEGSAGGSGQDVQVNNINLAFELPGGYRAAIVRFGEFGGNVNLRVNGELRNVGGFPTLDGELLGGVRITVEMDGDEPGAQHGLLRLEMETAAIQELAIGGQELWIDDVVFRDPQGGTLPAAFLGDGVRRLRMRDSAVRFREVGVLAARAQEWTLERVDIGAANPERWSQLRERYAGEEREAEEGAPAAEQRLTQVLAALEEVFSDPGGGNGFGLLAFWWDGCSVRQSRVAGRHAARAWWWLRGSLEGNELRGEESGCHAFWLHDADWFHNRAATSQGLALSFAGCLRARLHGNRVRSPVGVQNLSLADALQALEPLATALLRAYGPGATAELVAGTMADQSFELFGMRPLLDVLQPIVDEASPSGGVPASHLLGGWLLSVLRAQAERSLGGLPISDLAVVDNDLRCSLLGIGFERFLPFGSLRIADNRIHSATGQAVRVQTNPYAANAHLTALFFRTGLMLLIRTWRRLRDETDSEELQAIFGALLELFERWQAGAETLFDLDFRIEGNTIRSLRTAIEANLFELAILTNHITLQEREVVVGAARSGAVFGRVTLPNGGALPGASVRVVKTELVAFTDEKSEYRISGLPAGSYLLRATVAAHSVATAQVTLAAGEQVEVNFVVRPEFAAADLEHAGFSDSAIGMRTVPAMAGNPEILEVVQALETSPALEPLAVAMREGAHTIPESYAAYLSAGDGPLSTPAALAAAADAVTLIRGQTSDEELKSASGELSEALRANDRTRLASLLARFIRALQRYTDSQGIVLRGAGGRIVENHILVPADTRPETEALGGVQLSVNLAHVVVIAVLGSYLAGYLEGDEATASVDPLLGITDTLVDNNEVVGGIGHGISVQGVAGQPDFLNDLRIRGNQVRGTGGAGVFINEHALIVGLDLSDNHVSGCGRRDGFTRRKGGMVVQTAAACTLHGNHVLRCGSELQGEGAYGVDLDGIYDLRFTTNDVQANGSDDGSAEDGGVRLTEVYGSAQLHDNVVNFNRGLGLSWVNSAREDEAALLPPFLLLAVNGYLRMTRTVEQLVAEEQASVQGNAFKSVSDSDFPLFQLLNLREVLFSGNSCFAETRGAPLGEIQQAARGVITNNQTQTNAEIAIAVKKIADGVVLGNVGNRPIRLQSSAGLQSAFNVPATVT